MGFFDDIGAFAGDIGDFLGFGQQRDMRKLLDSMEKQRRQEFKQRGKRERGRLVQDLVRSGLGSSTILQGQKGALEELLQRRKTTMEGGIARDRFRGMELAGPSFGQMLLSGILGGAGSGFGNLFASLGTMRKNKQQGKIPELYRPPGGQQAPWESGFPYN